MNTKSSYLIDEETVCNRTAATRTAWHTGQRCRLVLDRSVNID